MYELTDQNILVPLLLPVSLPVQVHLYGVDGRQVMEIEVLAPEAQVGLQFRRGPRVQSAVQAHLAKVSFLGRHTLRLQQPYLQRVVRAPRLLRVRLNGFPQAAFQQPPITIPSGIISSRYNSIINTQLLIYKNGYPIFSIIFRYIKIVTIVEILDWIKNQIYRIRI